MRKKDRETEIKENYEVFEKLLPQLLEEHRDDFALMRHQKVVAIYPTMNEARQTGKERYKDDLFSVQEITDVPLNLSVLSDARIPGA